MCPWKHSWHGTDVKRAKRALVSPNFFPENINRAKGRPQGRNRSGTFVLTALKTLGQFNYFPPKLVWLTVLRKLFHHCRMCRLCGRSWNKSINMSCYTESHFLPNLSPKVSLTWMCWPTIPRNLLLQGSQDLERVGHSSLRWYSDSYGKLARSHAGTIFHQASYKSGKTVRQ